MYKHDQPKDQRKNSLVNEKLIILPSQKFRNLIRKGATDLKDEKLINQRGDQPLVRVISQSRIIIIINLCSIQ